VTVTAESAIANHSPLRLNVHLRRGKVA